MFDVKLDDKYAPLPRIALSDDASAVPLDNFTADRQAYSCSLVLAPSMQALKDAEDPIRILLIETNAVVFDEKYTDRIFTTGGSPFLLNFNALPNRFCRS